MIVEWSGGEGRGGEGKGLCGTLLRACGLGVTPTSVHQISPPSLLAFPWPTSPGYFPSASHSLRTAPVTLRRLPIRRLLADWEREGRDGGGRRGSEVGVRWRCVDSASLVADLVTLGGEAVSGVEGVEEWAELAGVLLRACGSVEEAVLWTRSFVPSPPHSSPHSSPALCVLEANTYSKQRQPLRPQSG